MNEVPMIETKINGRWKIKLPKHRADRPEWDINKGGWETARLNSINESMVNSYKKNQKEVMFYIGAEEGDMAGLISMWGADLVLFEPNDRVWPNIKAIWEANNLNDPLYCFPGFASNKDENANHIIKGFPEWANGPIIGDHGFKELADPGDIPQISIDSFVKITGLFPSAISLDVEGSEWRVLEGAVSTLMLYKPKIWLSGHPEFMYHHFKEHLGDLRTWIKKIGYKEKLLDYQHEVHLFYESI